MWNSTFATSSCLTYWFYLFPVVDVQTNHGRDPHYSHQKRLEQRQRIHHGSAARASRRRTGVSSLLSYSTHWDWPFAILQPLEAVAEARSSRVLPGRFVDAWRDYNRCRCNLCVRATSGERAHSHRPEGLAARTRHHRNLCGYVWYKNVSTRTIFNPSLCWKSTRGLAPEIAHFWTEEDRQIYDKEHDWYIKGNTYVVMLFSISGNWSGSFYSAYFKRFPGQPSYDARYILR